MSFIQSFIYSFIHLFVFINFFTHSNMYMYLVVISFVGCFISVGYMYMYIIGHKLHHIYFPAYIFIYM